MSDKGELVNLAKDLFLDMKSGVLSTTSVELEGYPFGSIVPFSLTERGELVILISDIAQHTKNILKDSRCSITVYKQTIGVDQQESPRVTFLADAKKVTDERREEISNLYLKDFPKAKSYFQAHSFSFYILEPKRVRFILGFGKINWIEKMEWCRS